MDKDKKVAALKQALNTIARCTAPDMRGLNKVAEATSSLLKNDGLEVLDKLSEHEDPKIKQLASELMAKVIPLIWSM